MIVRCNACESKYRVNQDKLPAGGGNIQCPGCGNIFYVASPEAPSTGQLQALPTGSTAAEEEDFSATQVGSIPSQLLAQATAAATPPPEAAPAPAARGKDADKWRLKTSFGLIYDFPDTQSLQSWLMAREDLEGYQLSRGGSDFKAIDSFKEVMTPGLRAKLTAAAVGLKPRKPAEPPRGLASSTDLPGRAKPGSSPELQSKPKSSSSSNVAAKGARPSSSSGVATKGGRPSSSPSVPTASRPGSSPTNPARGTGKRPMVTAPHLRAPARSNPNRWLAIGGLVLVLAGALGLQVSGVVDLRKLWSSPEPPPPVATATPAPTVEVAPVPTPPTPKSTGFPTRRDAPEVPVVPSPFGSQEQVVQLVDQARIDMNKRDYVKAVAGLQSAASIAPDNAEVFQLLEQALSRKGDLNGAHAARERYRELSAAQATPPPESPPSPAPTPAPSPTP